MESELWASKQVSAINENTEQVSIMTAGHKLSKKKELMFFLQLTIF